MKIQRYESKQEVIEARHCIKPFLNTLGLVVHREIKA